MVEDEFEEIAEEGNKMELEMAKWRNLAGLSLKSPQGMVAWT